MRRKRSVSKLIGTALGILLAAAAALLSAFDITGTAESGLVFRAFDVGQADACLFRFPDGRTMLVDAGGRDTAARLVTRLRRAGVRKLDIVVATHPHEDHIGGMPEVLGAFEIGKVWDSGYNRGGWVQRDMLDVIKRRGIRYGTPRAGHTEEAGGASIEVLAPAELASGTADDINNSSIILRVSYGGVSFLMMGDAEYDERRTIKEFPRTLVLKAGHHGSSNGIDSKMLKESRPKIAILSYGAGNPYGHPHKKTTDLLRKFGVKSYQTVNGDIIIRSPDGESWDIEQVKAR